MTLKEHYNYLQKWLIRSGADNQYFNSLNEIYIAIGSAMCETNSNAGLAEVRAELKKLLEENETGGFDYWTAQNLTCGIQSILDKVSEHFNEDK